MEYFMGRVRAAGRILHPSQKAFRVLAHLLTLFPHGAHYSKTNVPQAAEKTCQCGHVFFAAYRRIYLDQKCLNFGSDLVSSRLLGFSASYEVNGQCFCSILGKLCHILAHCRRSFKGPQVVAGDAGV